MRLALFAPLPPQRSGIADVTARLLEPLAAGADITLFHEEPAAVSRALAGRFPLRPIGGFQGPLAEGFDVCLYVIGNNVAYHGAIYAAARRYPGVLDLHDLNLHSFHGEWFLKRGRPAAYIREMAFAYGAGGVEHAHQALSGAAAYDVWRYPLFERLAALSLGVIAHSDYAAGRVTAACPDAHVTAILLPAAPPGNLPSAAVARARLGIDPAVFLAASFGYLSSAKRIEPVLRAVADLRLAMPTLRYALVGPGSDLYDPAPLIEELGLHDLVIRTGHVDEGTYQAYLAACDVGLNLRYPTFGESSATLIDLMGAGKATLVSDVDAFVELPADACAKVSVGPTEQREIVVWLRRLHADPTLGEAIGRRAAAYVRARHDPAGVAAEYLRYLEGVLDRDGSRWATV
jgi:glycosyltransferase involved in cell wall biosynthesis